MKKIRKRFAKLLVILMILPNFAAANIIDIDPQTESSYEIASRLEISNDTGTTWYNYSADANSGGETVNVNPGENLIFKHKVWNEGITGVTGIMIDQTILSLSYLEFNNVFLNDDEDNNGKSFTWQPFGDVIFLDTLAPGGSQSSGYESYTFTAKVKGTTPSNTTISATYWVVPDELDFEEEPERLVSIQLPQGTSISEVRVKTPTPMILGAETGPDELVAAGTESQIVLYLWILISFILAIVLFTSKKRSIKKY